MNGQSAYVVFKKGSTPDPSTALPADRAVPHFLKGLGTDPDLQLLDTATNAVYDAKAAKTLREAFFLTLQPRDMVVQASDGSSSAPLDNVRATLAELKTTKAGGIYAPGSDLWLLDPPDKNPNFDSDIDGMIQASVDFDAHNVSAPPGPPPASAPGPTAPPAEPRQNLPEDYPVTAHDNQDIDLFPGLSGEKILDSTVAFVRESNPVTLALVGGAVGLVSYLTMGRRGFFAVLLALMALRRHLRMGNKAIMDQRLDLVARGIQEGHPPIDKTGRIDPEYLDALRQFPVGDQHLISRKISPSVAAREWEQNPIAIPPESLQLESKKETIGQVVDGDTFVVERPFTPEEIAAFPDTGGHRPKAGDKARYRLVGVDAPEIDHNDPSKNQAGAKPAWDRVRQLIPPGSRVDVEIAKNQPMYHGRLPCYLYVTDQAGNKTCVNEMLLKEGLARVTTFRPYHAKMLDFVNASTEAISNHAGMWNARYDPKPAPRFFSVEATRQKTSERKESVSFSMA